MLAVIDIVLCILACIGVAWLWLDDIRGWKTAERYKRLADGYLRLYLEECKIDEVLYDYPKDDIV